MPVKVSCDGCGKKMPDELVQLVIIKNLGSYSGNFIVLNNTIDTTWISNKDPSNDEILVACDMVCAKTIFEDKNIKEKIVEKWWRDNPEESN